MRIWVWGADGEAAPLRGRLCRERSLYLSVFDPSPLRLDVASPLLPAVSLSYGPATSTDAGCVAVRIKAHARAHLRRRQ